MVTSFYTEEELAGLGLKSYGSNVLISRHACIYGSENISVGHDVRIDDFCILSGRITIGSYVHIAAYCALYAGSFGITLKDFSGLSSRCAVYAMSDDFSGEALGPTVPDEFRNVKGGEVVLENYASVGTGCTILPGVHIAEGTAVWAMSMVHKPLKEWGIYFGVPCRRVKERSRKMRELGEELMKQDCSSPKQA